MSPRDIWLGGRGLPTPRGLVAAAVALSVVCFVLSQSWIYEHVEREICPDSCTTGPNPTNITLPLVLAAAALCVLAIAATTWWVRSGSRGNEGRTTVFAAGGLVASATIFVACGGIVISRKLFSDGAADENCEVPVTPAGGPSNADCLPTHEPASFIWFLAGAALLIAAVSLAMHLVHKGRADL